MATRSTTKAKHRPARKRKSAPTHKRARATHETADPPIRGRRVVIRFNNATVVPHTDGTDDKPGAWGSLARTHGPLILRRMFVSQPERLRELAEIARRRNPGYRWANFLNYFHLYAQSADRAERLACELREKWPQIELAYIDRATENANAPASVAQCLIGSGHIDPAEDGVDAAFAWQFTGGKGEGQFLVDVESGWAKNHVRLPSSRIPELAGRSAIGARDHGTAVLGIICSTHSSPGCHGIAPAIDEAGLVSCVPNPNAPSLQPVVRPDNLQTERMENVYDAISIGIEHLIQAKNSAGNAGGVLLLERQTEDGLPVEVLEGVRDLLALANANDITVIEAAGNAGIDLDTIQDANGAFPLVRVSRASDSGAIMVGSAHRNVVNRIAAGTGQHSRFATSNFGSRLDCYAWGERVMSLTWTPGVSVPLPGILDQCETFGQTSAAAAIIAGVALVVQGIAMAGGKSLGASRLRDILGDPALGTASVPGDRIGVMPDLAKILQSSPQGFCAALGVNLHRPS